MDEKAKILLIDIETQPDLVWVWRLYDANAISVKDHWKLLSFSAEWLGGEAITKGLDDYPRYTPKGDDKRLVADIWKLLDVADIVVGHNAAGFDVKKINARFIFHGMTPPAPYKVVDTLREIRKVAKFSSNKLDWLSKQLQLGKKITHEGFPLWRGCMEGDLAAWRRMKKYNRHDVILLRKLYKKLAPWISQPNANMWSDGVVCPNPACGSRNLIKKGFGHARTRTYQRYRCGDCGKPARSVQSEKQGAAVVQV